ncbi:hypothetical protein NDU88_000289 [Pleurodeles waltl]|uniref:Uncharacterized protein n=1 Tax=Pleurodeles waltl TaxID=8319 RepID=A0AAV7UPK2_PLEWA|nr:hypothetical protein NDU88_000289 [Pleurodeles waltl]
MGVCCSDGLLLQPTDPPYSEEENGTATPDPEVQCWLTNPLSHLGAEEQRQWLRAVFGFKTEDGTGEGEKIDESRGRSRTNKDVEEGREENTADGCGS